MNLRDARHRDWRQRRELLRQWLDGFRGFACAFVTPLRNTSSTIWSK
jgi:hypothetical protein